MLHALLRLGFTTISLSQADNDYDTRGSPFSDDRRNDEMQSVALRCPAPHSLRDLMQVTAGEGLREECLKGRLNRTGVFALVRGQVSPGDERIESFRVRVMRLTCMAGLAGLPQMNLPVGTVSGCPVGLSLIGWPGSDEVLLDLTKSLARYCGIADL
jgi:Amidase